MKYTRYKYKNYGRTKFIISIILVASISIGGGLYAGNSFFSRKAGSSAAQVMAEKETEDNFIILQCGYYANRDNAEANAKKIENYCRPFISEEDGKYRVIAGIYNIETGRKKIDELKENSIDVAKVDLKPFGNTEDDAKALEIFLGYIQITDKVDESDVKSIKTDGFKEWTSQTIGDKADSDLIKNIKEYVSSLPDEITKSNEQEYTEKLYALLKK